MNIKKYGFIKLLLMYWRKMDKHDTIGLTAEMSFYLLTALFPFFILLFCIATHISESMQNMLLNAITYLPKALEDMLTSLLLSFKQTLPIIITSAVLGLWYTSNVISTITKALNRFYDVKETRGYLKLRGMFLLYSLFIILLVLLSFALIIFSEGTQFLLNYSNLIPFLKTDTVWNYTRYITLILVIFITLVVMFKTLPNRVLSFKAVTSGAALTTIAWCIASYGFSFYVNYFSKYHVIYGSLTSIIVLITWVYLTSFVILFGGSINAFWFRIRIAKKITKARRAAFKDTM